MVTAERGPESKGKNLAAVDDVRLEPSLRVMKRSAGRALTIDENYRFLRVRVAGRDRSLEELQPDSACRVNN